jgi:hypothetical protein
MIVQPGSPGVPAEEQEQRALMKALGGTVRHFFGEMAGDFPRGS